MTLSELEKLCLETFGERGKSDDSDETTQEPTGGLGIMKTARINGTDKCLFVARQGGPSNVGDSYTYDRWKVYPVENEPFKLLFQKSQKTRRIIDCRDHVLTRRRKGEWTGYHAEMVILSGIIKLAFNYISPDQVAANANHVQTVLKASGVKIAANAACCKHCHSMLTALGIEHPQPAKIKPSNTGWWNPFTDGVYPHGSLEFGKNIPGF